MATLPESTATVQFDTTLRTLAAQARTRYAGEQARIDRGLVIALNGGVTLQADGAGLERGVVFARNGGVTLQADGAALVSSQRDDEVFYIVRDGQCDCPDFSRAPGGRCKHRFAVCLVKRVQQQVREAQTVRHYALYTAPDGTAHDGIATQTGQGWLFVAEDGMDPLFASHAALVLYGLVDLADAALADDTRVEGSRVLTLLAR